MILGARREGAVDTSNERSVVENVWLVGVGRYTSTGIFVGTYVPFNKA